MQQHIAAVEEASRGGGDLEVSDDSAEVCGGDADIPEDMLDAVATPGYVPKFLNCPGFDLDSARNLGRRVYHLFRNHTPMTLLNCYCPVIDPENCEVYYAEAQHTVAAFRLNRLYKVALDGGSMRQLEEKMSMHEALRKAMRDAHK